MRTAICFQIFLNRRKNNLCDLFSVCGVKMLGNTEMCTAELLHSDCYWKAEKYVSPGTHQITAEFIQAVSKTLHSEIHMYINYIWSREELSQ
jgi:hypothetical protein